jgi:hypothetical protein
MPNKRGRPVKPLSEDDIRTIRALYRKMSGAEIGRIYDRSQCAINAIQRGRTYRYVSAEPQTGPRIIKKFSVSDWAAGIRSNGVATNEINGDPDNGDQDREI